MTDEKDLSFEGGCACRAVRYRMMSKPIFVHCCHCRWCQRETGASFALNALIEADRVVLLCGSPEMVDAPSNSGKGQRIVRVELHCGATTEARATRSASFVSAPSTNPIDFRRTSIFSRCRSSRGWSSRRALTRSANTTSATSIGRRKASRAGAPFSARVRLPFPHSPPFRTLRTKVEADPKGTR
jgi:hypothetical protein